MTEPAAAAHNQADHATATLSVLMFASGATAVSNSIIFAALGDLQDTYGFADIGLGVIAGIGFLVGHSHGKCERGLILRAYHGEFSPIGFAGNLVNGVHIGNIVGIVGHITDM